MTERPPSSSRTHSSEDAEVLFDDYLESLESGEAEDFESFVGRHPEHEAELRALHEDWRRIESTMESALPAPLPDESG